MSRIRLVPVVFILIMTLSVLFGAFVAYRQFKLVGPLQNELQAIPGVQTAQVETGNPSLVKIKLGPVPKLANQDLQSTYVKIVGIISGVFSGTNNLDIVDNQDQELTSAYESFQPILLEGIAKGNFVEMIAAVEQKASQAGIQARVTMDVHNIYIQLSKGNHYLYDVFQYTTLRQGGGTP